MQAKRVRKHSSSSNFVSKQIEYGMPYGGSLMQYNV